MYNKNLFPAPFFPLLKLKYRQGAIAVAPATLYRKISHGTPRFPAQALSIYNL
jgi:hypothetical protein